MPCLPRMLAELSNKKPSPSRQFSPYRLYLNLLLKLRDLLSHMILITLELIVYLAHSLGVEILHRNMRFYLSIILLGILSCNP